jgi:flagellar hook assembly protein FlgD
MAALVGQSSLSASLIGRQVEAIGDTVEVGSNGHPSIRVDVGGSGGSATLTLMDNSGTVVATRELGTVHGGDGQKLSLPNDLPAGTWHYALSVKGPDGKPAGVTTYVSGVVSAVEFKNGKIMLLAGGLEIALDDLVRIEPVTGTTSTPSNPPSPTTTPSPLTTLGGPPAVGGEEPILPTFGRH